MSETDRDHGVIVVWAFVIVIAVYLATQFKGLPLKLPQPPTRAESPPKHKRRLFPFLHPRDYYAPDKR